MVIDAVFLSIRPRSYKKEPGYTSPGGGPVGEREILGFWVMVSEGESARTWREIFSELRERGVERTDIVVPGDLFGIKEAISSLFPGADRKLPITCAMRNCKRKVKRRDWEKVSEGLKAVYRADFRDEAEAALDAFQDAWKKRYPNLVRYWRENFVSLSALFKYPEQVRPYIYTTRKLERI